MESVIYTDENKQKAIAWINAQFQFTAKELYAYMCTQADTKLAEYCRRIIQTGKIYYLIQQVGIGKYMLLKPMPNNIMLRNSYKLTEREKIYGRQIKFVTNKK